MTDPMRDSNLPTVPPVLSDPLLDVPAVAGTAAGLAEQAEKLAQEVKGLRLTADGLAKRARRNEWTTGLTALGLVLDIALSVFAFVLLHNQSVSDARLEASIHETCTLYGFIIPSYRESAKATSPLGPDEYDNFYRAMQASADHLKCGIPHRI